jgi:Arc/MetJ-type ribon-helix-helix transcriptional regulator
MGDTTIRVSSEDRDRANQLAADYGLTQSDVVRHALRRIPTKAEAAATQARALAYLKEHFGFDPTPDELSTGLAEAERIWANAPRGHA